MRLSNDLSEHGAHRSSIEGHELERKRNELVHGGCDSSQIEILQDRGVARKKHIVHGKVFAFSGIDRWSIDAEEPEATPEEHADARLGQGRPIFRESAACDRSPSTQKQSLDEGERLDLLEILHLDLLAEAGHIHHDGRTVESVEQQLVRAGPPFADMEWRIGVGADVRARAE